MNVYLIGLIGLIVLIGINIPFICCYRCHCKNNNNNNNNNDEYNKNEYNEIV